MGMSWEEFWLCPFGYFLDLWECHKQFLGIAKPLMDDTEALDALFPEDD